MFQQLQFCWKHKLIAALLLIILNFICIISKERRKRFHFHGSVLFKIDLLKWVKISHKLIPNEYNSVKYSRPFDDEEKMNVGPLYRMPFIRLQSVLSQFWGKMCWSTLNIDAFAYRFSRSFSPLTISSLSLVLFGKISRNIHLSTDNAQYIKHGDMTINIQNERVI